MATIKLDKAQVARLPRLLYMEYTPRELAEEIGISVRYVRRNLIPAGMPHRRDGNGRIWIIGEEFTQWYRELRKRSKHQMKPNEAWCMRCRQAVPMHNPQVIKTQALTEILSATCPYCEATICRARARAS